MLLSCLFSVERLEFVGLHRCFVLMQVCQRILCAIMVSIIVGIYCLRLQTRNSVNLLDCCCSETCQCTEHSAFDLCNFSILNCIYQGVLRLCSVVLQLLGCVLFAKGCDLVKIHF